MPAPILAYEKLSLIQGSGRLFHDLDIFIEPRDRLALIGRNGAGKSTLLRLLAGEIDSDVGRRTIVPGTRVVLLEQEPDLRGFSTLADYAVSGDHAPALHEAEAIASQIGIDLSRPAATASGGEKRRAAIARALAMDPQVLLLDEPTNHLDLAAITWLEDWLARFSGAFVVISHDRTFLTRLTKQTLWLDRGQICRAEVGYGGFEAWQDKVFADEARAADKLDARLKIEEHWLHRGVTARRKRNMGRLEKLHEMRAQRAAMLGPQGAAKLGIASDDVRTKVVIDAQNISKAYQIPLMSSEVETPGRVSTSPDMCGAGEVSGDGEVRRIIKDFTLRIQRGDRIGIVGANGAGKTTLLKLLTGEIAPDTGKVTLAKTLTGIVIDQQRALLSPEKRVRDVLADGGDWIEVRGSKTHIHGYLKDFLFDPGMTEARIGTLSGGEQSRLLLAREFARASNLLVLDEPTNDLDMETLDLLQETIADYDGTVLIVSHDRDFLDRTVTITLGLDGSGKVDVIAGGYADWEAKRSATADSSRHPGGGRDKAVAGYRSEQKGTVPASAGMTKKAGKLSYKDQRDYDLLPTRIDEIAAQIAQDEAALNDASLYARDPKRFAALTAAIDAARAEKDAAEERWLALAEQVEAAA